MSSRTVFSVLDETARLHGRTPALHQPAGGKYHSWTWEEYRDAVRETASGLRRLGVQKGGVVALVSETRAEFYFADLGIMAAGAISAACYPSYPPPELARTLKACRANVVFVDTPKMLAALRAAAGSDLKALWILLTGDAENAYTLDGLRAMGREAIGDDSELFTRVQAQIHPEDYAILYLTSGATGEPKMGLVTHAALVANIDMGTQVVDLGPKDAVLAFLPSAHIAQRVGVELLSMRMAVPTWFSEGLSKMPHELQKVRPTFLLAPPRVWERVYSSVATEIRKRGGFTRRLFHGALGLGLRASRLRQRGEPVPAWLARSLKVADRLVFRKLRARFGGRMRLPVSGAAPLGKDLAQFYDAIGMPLIEGYGLTEGGITTLNPVHAPRLGSIGRMLPGVEHRITEEGELALRGPTLFSGYFHDPDATAAVLRDGWLATGDLAEEDADGYIYITGRKKEMIVASNGKKIYPSRVENLFKVEPVVNQMILVGDGKPYVSALFTINTAAAEALRGMESYRGLPAEEIAAAPPVHEEVKRAVARANRQLAPFEQIRKFRILERDFSIEEGELTATMKVRRARVLENRRSAISEIYTGRDEPE